MIKKDREKQKKLERENMEQDRKGNREQKEIGQKWEDIDKEIEKGEERRKGKGSRHRG